MPEEQLLVRRIPSDWVHVLKYSLAATAPITVPRVEQSLKLLNYRNIYLQGAKNACVGFSSSWMMSILNRKRYDPWWLWDQAKGIDEWSDTNPGDNNGTSVRAAMDVLRIIGHVRVFDGRDRPFALVEGIQENRWATTTDEVRTVIASGAPLVFGINWYQNFDTPVKKGGRWWIGLGDLGTIRGGHAVCIYRASDKLQAVGIVNSWTGFPLVLMPYAIVERLLHEQGEASMVTDRP